MVFLYGSVTPTTCYGFIHDSRRFFPPRHAPFEKGVFLSFVVNINQILTNIDKYWQKIQYTNPYKKGTNIINPYKKGINIIKYWILYNIGIKWATMYQLY